jgi:hypothetical protein
MTAFPGTRLLRQSDISQGRIRGRECEFEYEDKMRKARLFIDSERFYSVWAASPKDARFAADSTRFFDSFKIANADKKP